MSRNLKDYWGNFFSSVLLIVFAFSGVFLLMAATIGQFIGRDMSNSYVFASFAFLFVLFTLIGLMVIATTRLTAFVLMRRLISRLNRVSDDFLSGIHRNQSNLFVSITEENALNIHYSEGKFSFGWARKIGSPVCPTESIRLAAIWLIEEMGRMNLEDGEQPILSVEVVDYITRELRPGRSVETKYMGMSPAEKVIYHLDRLGTVDKVA